jgi:8-oxo-dGTP pyrophosphatase MutT (NUDIX family)
VSASEYIKRLRAKVGTMPIMLPSVAAVILNSEGRLLLQQKQDESWSLPAGMIEPGESPTQAIIREVKEETGLCVVVERVIGIFGGEGFDFTYPNGDQVEYMVILFKCNNIIGHECSELENETLRLEWFSKFSLPQLSLPYPIECLFAENTTIELS